MTEAPRSHTASIEPLESRIAPALLVNGANLLGGGSPASGETSVGDHSVTLVKVLSGQALVWFDGFSITSISVGPGTSLDITGDVLGDIVANLETDGTLTDSDGIVENGEDGGLLLANNVLGIKTHPLSTEKGSIGHIITGGSISNVDISGEIKGIYAGDGVFRAESAIGSLGSFSSVTDIDINPIEPGVQDTFVVTQAGSTIAGGASINNVHVTLGDTLQVFAGNGSPNNIAATGKAVAGGSINKLIIDSARPSGLVPSYYLIAGDGGDGKIGGAGGSISSVIEITSTGNVMIKAGSGGDGNGGAGGAGGSLLNLDLQSSSSQYSAKSGDGGAGTPGGAGGRVVNNNFSNRTPISGVIISGDFDGDGNDDVLVADSGSGDLELNRNLGNGAFARVLQYDPDNDPNTTNDFVFTIDGVAATPLDGVATDFDFDGDLDAVVLYSDGSLTAFLNQGSGVFYNAADSAFALNVQNVGFTPSKLSQVRPDSIAYAVSENTEGKGVLHGVSFGSIGGSDIFEVYQKTLKYNLPIADVVRDYVGLTDGTIQQFGITIIDDQPALQAIQTIAPTFPGGLSDLDVDQDGTRLLVMSSASRTLGVLDISGTTAVSLGTISLATVQGRPLSAKFIHDGNATTPDNIVVLSAGTVTSQFTLLTAAVDDNDPLTPPVTSPYTISASFDSASLLKNFAPVYSDGQAQPALAALTGSLSTFTVVSNFASEATYELDFASKTVNVESGAGGTGLDAGRLLGKGGAGGAIVNLNIDAQNIFVTTGAGGNSTSGAAGAAGSISNSVTPTLLTNDDGSVTKLPGSFKSAGGASIVPKLSAAAILEITLSDGGTPLGLGDTKAASGGAGGSILGLTMELADGTITLTAGNGGNGKAGVGGAGGDIRGLVASTMGGGLVLVAGHGGDSTARIANGGAGGSIANLKFTMLLDANAEKNEVPYDVSLTAGNGGSSFGGIGGAGGRLDGVTLVVDGADSTFDDGSANPPLVNAHLDTTVSITGRAGVGGNGAKGGGVGGSIVGFSSTTVIDQLYKGFVKDTYVVLDLTAGAGGSASAGNGGAGGSVIFGKPISGISDFDTDRPGFDPTIPALIVVAGDGGSGSAKGGVGGSISGLTAQNAPLADGRVITQTQLFSATLLAGAGGNGGTGDGGAGGTVSKSLVAVSGGVLNVFGGAGGDSANAKGGIGGGVTGSEFGLVGSGFGLGMLIAGGTGGDGKTFGGTGGAVSKLSINTPQSTFGLSAVIVAGNGGTADSAAGTGGKGGDVNGITQAKDFNSSINVIQAGDGGKNDPGKGGAGGNVLNIRTVGFLGRPSTSMGTRVGVFDQASNVLIDDDLDPTTTQISASVSFAQGVFSGRGGDGTTDGIAGSISNVAARQIAAMSASVDVSTGLFAKATKISNVKTGLIGFNVDIMDETCDDENDTPMTPSGNTPATVVAKDGFLMASSIANIIVTGTARPNFMFVG